MEETPRKLSAADQAARAIAGGKIEWFHLDIEDLLHVHSALLSAIEGAARGLAVWARALRELEEWRREKVCEQLEAERREVATDPDQDPPLDLTSWH